MVHSEAGVSQEYWEQSQYTHSHTFIYIKVLLINLLKDLKVENPEEISVNMERT